MRNIWNWIRTNPNRAMFLVPILLVAGISISHVVSWYDMTNPINWAVYLSIAIEVGAMTALIAATNKIKGGVWFMFGLVTIIQLIGNIFYSYKEIDVNGDLFKSWVELTGPIWEMFGTESTDIIGLKRWLAMISGGFLPIISLTSLHFFIKYEKTNTPKIEPKKFSTIIQEPDLNGLRSIPSVQPNNDPIEPIVTLEPSDELPEKRIYNNQVENIPEEDMEEYVKGVAEKFKEPVVFESDLPNIEHVDTFPLEEEVIEEIVTTQKPVEEQIEPPTPPSDTSGEELSRTWGNIVKRRRRGGNNGVSKI